MAQQATTKAAPISDARRLIALDAIAASGGRATATQLKSAILASEPTTDAATVYSWVGYAARQGIVVRVSRGVYTAPKEKGIIARRPQYVANVANVPTPAPAAEPNPIQDLVQTAMQLGIKMERVNNTLRNAAAGTSMGQELLNLIQKGR